MSITHLHNLDISEILFYLESSEKFEYSEKFDGANLRLSRDTVGKYHISREARGDRKYSLDDEIPMNNRNVFRRIAQKFFSDATIAYSDLFFGPELHAEFEVLMGRRPNAIDYGLQDDEVVFVYTGGLHGLYLPTKWENISSEVTLMVPSDGVAGMVQKTFKCSIHVPRPQPAPKIPNTQEWVNKIMDVLGKEIVPTMTVQDLYARAMNRTISGYTFKETKVLISKARDEIASLKSEMEPVFKYIKQVFLDGRKSSLNGSMIEGVILRPTMHYLVDVYQFKLVSDDFKTFKDTIWSSLNSLASIELSTNISNSFSIDKSISYLEDVITRPAKETQSLKVDIEHKRKKQARDMLDSLKTKRDKLNVNQEN